MKFPTPSRCCCPYTKVVEDISPSRLTAREVQKIALLDMRILNRDRNSVNILVRSRPRRSTSFSDRSVSSHLRHGSIDGNIGLSVSAPGTSNVSSSKSGSSFRSHVSGGLSNSGGGGRRSIRMLGGGTEYELIPIDHGLCLSDELAIDWCDWCWLDWRQVKEVSIARVTNQRLIWQGLCGCKREGWLDKRNGFRHRLLDSSFSVSAYSSVPFSWLWYMMIPVLQDSNALFTQGG